MIETEALGVLSRHRWYATDPYRKWTIRNGDHEPVAVLHQSDDIKVQPYVLRWKDESLEEAYFDGNLDPEVALGMAAAWVEGFLFGEKLGKKSAENYRGDIKVLHEALDGDDQVDPEAVLHDALAIVVRDCQSQELAELAQAEMKGNE